MSLLMHLLVPMASARLDARQAEIAQNVTARLLTPGTFLEPMDGLTFYIGDVAPQGELQDVYLTDLRDPARQITYTAAQAYLVQSDASTQLVMVDGLAQVLMTEDQTLSTTSFEDFAYDIGNLMAAAPRAGRRDAQVPTLELLRASDALVAETGRTRARLIARAHDRVSQSLLAVVAALLGFSALIIGGFSRFGVWRQIVIAVFLIITVKAVETAGINAAREDASLWFAVYGGVVTGLIIVAILLFLAARPALFKRKGATS